MRGAGTKLGWGVPGPDPDVELRTTGLHRVLEHNEGDLTAVLEAGVSMEVAQATFASTGQMLALDPPLGLGGESAARRVGVPQHYVLVLVALLLLFLALVEYLDQSRRKPSAAAT